MIETLVIAMPEKMEELAFRVVRLETQVSLKFDELERSITLAREQVEAQKQQVKHDLDMRLEGMNEFRQQINRMEGTLVNREALTREIKYINKAMNSLTKLVYIGVGAALVLQLVIKFFI